jgi:hypothetical protein
MQKLKVISLLSMIMVTAVGLDAALVLNNTDRVFPPPPPGEGTMLQVAPAAGGREEISSLMIDGAAKFLDSYSEALILLREYEMSAKAPFDMNLALLKAESALQKLEDSRGDYAAALAVAEKLEYVQYYRDKLTEFNYNSYAEERKFIPGVTEEVKGFLGSGDVVGLYRRNLDKIDGIILVLKTIHSELNRGVKPDVTLFWTVLEEYSKAALFGNYATVLSKKAFI